MAESLVSFVQEVNGTSHLRVEQDFGDGFVRLLTSEAERRQAAQDIRCTEDIVLEMLRNSRDAHASNIFVATGREGHARNLSVIDDGCGIPPAMHERVFEPRVTSKLDTSHMDAWGMHGRGMALYSIAVNATVAQVAASAPDCGCAIRVKTDITSLNERSDQSSFPTFELSEAGTVNVRGPRNILRTVCEFAIDSRSQCSVYIGSTAEVCATLYAYGSSTLSAIDRLFCRDVEAIPVTKRLATASDPSEFVAIAESLGVPVSERTARRIMDGDLVELCPVLDRVSITAPVGTGRRSATKAPSDGRGLRLQPTDIAALAAALSEAYADIAEKYYLEPDVEPRVRVQRDRIAVTVPVVKKP